MGDVGVLNAHDFRAQKHRAGLQPAEHHVFGEAEKLIEILVDARLGDERADVLAPVDDAVVLQLAERPAHRLARRAVTAHQFGLGRQSRVRRHLLARDVVAQGIRNGDVHRCFGHGGFGSHVV